MPAASSSLDPSAVMPWDILPGVDAPLDLVQAPYAVAVDRLSVAPELAPYADVLLAEEFSAAQFVWLVRAAAANLLERAESVAADRDADAA